MCRSHLLCEYKDGEQMFANQVFETCYIDNVSVQERKQQQNWVSLYPNPASETVRIEGVRPAEVQVYNALGQVVKTVRGTNEVPVMDLLQGVYLLRIADAEGKVYTNKITKR
jgi:hypothetical protein